MNCNLRIYNEFVPRLGERVYVDPRATVIGDVLLGDDVSVWPGAVVRGDMHSIRIGHRSNVQDNAILHITHASDYNPDGWPLTIGDRVLVGIGSIVNDGAIVEDEVIIGAGCLVPPGKTLTSGFVYVGNPCRQLRAITADERRFFTYSAANYVKLKNQYLAEQS